MVAAGWTTGVFVGTTTVGVNDGCGVSVGTIVGWIGLGVTVGAEVPAGVEVDSRKGIYSANNRVRVKVSNKVRAFLNQCCAPRRKVAFLFTIRWFWAKE